MIDANTPIQNPELLASIQALKNEYTQENEQNFIVAITSAHYLLPVIIDDPKEVQGDRQITLKKEMSIKLIHLSNQKGELYLPVFTDWSQVNKWNQEANIQTLVVTFKEVYAVIREGQYYQGITLNPFDENMLFSKQQLAEIFSENNSDN